MKLYGLLAGLFSRWITDVSESYSSLSCAGQFFLRRVFLSPAWNVQVKLPMFSGHCVYVFRTKCVCKYSLNLLISIFCPSLEWNCLNLIIYSIRLRWSTEITSGCLKKIVNPIYMSLIVTVTWGCGKGIRHMIVWKSVGQSVWAQVWWEERCHSVEKRPVD